MKSTDFRPDSAGTMPPDEIYTDNLDRQRHLGHMHAIAEEMQRPFHEVVELYEEVLRHLKMQARIVDYLPILVSKKVKERCRRH